MAVRDMVHEAYKLASDLYPTYKYVMIGHSLGGAIATLCAIDVHTKFGVEPTLYTFASPRVLNPTMAQWANLKFPHLRVVNQIDIVPKLPTEVMGFRHLAQEVWIQPDQSLRFCDLSGEDPTCSLSVGLTPFFDKKATCQIFGNTKEWPNCHAVYLDVQMTPEGCVV
eukprot:Colp12_sorted_trinity150504_noHs@33873